MGEGQHRQDRDGREATLRRRAVLLGAAIGVGAWAVPTVAEASMSTAAAASGSPRRVGYGQGGSQGVGPDGNRAGGQGLGR